MTPLRWMLVCLGAMAGAAVAHTFGQPIGVAAFSGIVLIAAYYAMRRQ